MCLEKEVCKFKGDKLCFRIKDEKQSFAEF